MKDGSPTSPVLPRDQLPLAHSISHPQTLSKNKSKTSISADEKANSISKQRVSKSTTVSQKLDNSVVYLDLGLTKSI